MIVKTWIPEHSEVAELSRLSALVSIDDYVGSHGHPGRIRLVSSDGQCIYLDAAYDDVRFKFECYFVVVGSPPEHIVRWQTAKTIQDFQSVRMLMGFQWERPARPGELPPSYEDIVGDMGLRQDIPSNAQALGVFVHGFAFWNDAENRPVAAIVASHDVPGTLEILTERKDLDATLAVCEVVDIPTLNDWAAELNVWLERWKSAPYPQPTLP